MNKIEFAQEIAKKTIAHLKRVIYPGINEIQVVQMAEKYMRNLGVKNFWYHDVGALVLIGKRTITSTSGRHYKPTSEILRCNDLITIDLSPTFEGRWGDYARSIVISNGIVVSELKELSNDSELKIGLQAELILHNEFKRIFKKDMTFEKIFFLMNCKISELGFVNLDFRSNLGHTIENNLHERKYIESGNKTKIGDIQYFTFEPHIKKKNGLYGFKLENIYYVDSYRLIEI